MRKENWQQGSETTRWQNWRQQQQDNETMRKTHGDKIDNPKEQWKHEKSGIFCYNNIGSTFIAHITSY